jgi:ADP-ribose pyrophosphatase
VGRPIAKVLSSQAVFQGKVFSVRRDEVVEPGGIICTREIVVHRGSVVVLPVFEDGMILLVRQYRHAIGRFLWELVAGRIETGESLEKAARRELIEEGGYTAKRMRRLVTFFPSPGLLSEQMYVLIATGLTRCAAKPEEDERIAVGCFALARTMRMIRRGTILDGKTIASVLYYSEVAQQKRANK